MSARNTPRTHWYFEGIWRHNTMRMTIAYGELVESRLGKSVSTLSLLVKYKDFQLLEYHQQYYLNQTLTFGFG